jgi:hypothetical protein
MRWAFLIWSLYNHPQLRIREGLGFSENGRIRDQGWLGSICMNQEQLLYQWSIIGTCIVNPYPGSTRLRISMDWIDSPRWANPNSILFRLTRGSENIEFWSPLAHKAKNCTALTMILVFKRFVMLWRVQVRNDVDGKPSPLSNLQGGWTWFHHFGQYRGDWVNSRTFLEDRISSSTHTIHTETVSTCTWCPYLNCCPWRALVRIILNSKWTSAQIESPTLFLVFWVPTNTIHAISPWFRGIAQQPRDNSEAHC